MEMIILMDKILKNIKNIWGDTKSGLTYNELLVLMAIKRDFNSLKEVCSFLLTDRSQTFKVLESLILKGCIVKNKNPPKASVYILTPIGKDALIEVYSIKDFIVNVDFKDISRIELELTRETLRKQEKILTDLYSGGDSKKT